MELPSTQKYCITKDYSFEVALLFTLFVLEPEACLYLWRLLI